MDLNSSIGVLWRRKGLTFTLLLFTFVGTIGAFVILPWTYKASVTETLLNSEESSQSLGGGNPYLSFDSALVEMANILTFKLTDSQNLLALQQQGDTASVQAQILSENAENEEPFIQISVSGSNKATVAQTLQGAVSALSSQLAQLQTGLPAQERASLQTIAETSTPVRSVGAKLKPLVGFLGVGLVLTFVLPQAVDGAATRRRKTQAKVNSSADDRSTSGNKSQENRSDQFRQGRPAEAKSESAQRQRNDRQTGDNFREQRVPPTRQGMHNPTRPEYGSPPPGDSRYSETERRW